MAQKHVILGDKNNVEILNILGAGILADNRWIFIAVIAWGASMHSSWVQYKKLREKLNQKK